MQREAKAAVEPVRQRTQYSCMAASMTMCLKALGYENLDEDQVNRVMGAQPMKGAAWEQALACAQHYGCRATLTMPATVEQLKSWTDSGVPVMIAWNPEGRPWSHASVVFDVDADLNVYVADPNIPNPKETVRIVSEADFYGKWYEKFPDYLVRRPACAIEREITLDGKQVDILSKAGPNVVQLLGLKTASDRAATFWTDPHKSPAGVPYPKSKWDKLGRLAPFRWATPAPNVGGAFPEPWRTSDKDAALAWLKKEFPEHSDIYTDNDGEFHGYGRIWVGLRDNRDKGSHLTRLTRMRHTLEDAGWPVLAHPQGTAFWLKDDLLRDVLRGKAAKATQKAPKTQEEKRKEDSHITAPGDKNRNPVVRDLVDRGQAGQGSHKNKQDYDRGHARKPKHPGRDREAAEVAHLADRFLRAQGAFWTPISGGWKHVTETVLAHLVWETVTEYVRDRNVPSLEEVADPEMLADFIPEMMAAHATAARAHEQWVRQGWWPKPVQAKGLLLAIHHKPTRKDFEAHFPAADLHKAQTEGEKAVSLVEAQKRPSWLQPAKAAAYSGNPNGKPIYDVAVDHGEEQALSGGWDIMKRLQDQYRIEQGHGPRDPNPRLARWNANTKAQVDRLARRVLTQIGGNK